jgi:iron(III) transport system substrate-binding protein
MDTHCPSPIPFSHFSPPALWLLLVLLVACGKSDSSSEGQNQSPHPAAVAGSDAQHPATAGRSVVVYSPHGQEILDEYAAAFHRGHPDIQVVGRFLPTGEILSQLRIDKTAPKVDVWWGGTSAFFSQAKADGLLKAYRPWWVGVAKPGYHDAEDFWYAQFVEVAAIVGNKSLYKREDLPATWDDLLASKWRDKIVVREPMGSGTMTTIFTGLVWRLGGESHDPAPGYDFLKKLDAQTHLYLPSPQALYDRIAKSPEGYVSPWNLTDILFQAHANGYPFEYRIPEGAFPISLDPIALVAGAPHLEEAKMFYEFVTSKESCLKMARDHFRLLARTDIAPEELPDWTKDVHFEAMPIDQEAFDRLQPDWMRHWREAIRNPEK